MLNKIAVFWLLIEKILRIISGIFVSTAVARHLGPESYGILAVAIGTISIFSAAAAMGADHINVSELSKRSEAGKWMFLFSALITRFLWSIFCFSFLIIVILLKPPENEIIYLILAGLIPMASFSILGNKLQSDGYFFQYTVLCCTAIIVSATFRVVGILLSASIQYFAVVTLLDSVIISVVFAIFLFTRKDFNQSYLNPQWSEVKRYFLLSFPTALSIAMVALYLRLELFVIDFLLGKTAAGLWAASMIFVTPWGMVASAILPVANRWLSQYGSNTEDHQIKMIKLIRWMFLLASIAVIFNILAVTTLVPLLFGDKFHQVREVVWICSFAIIPLFMGSVQEIWLAQRRTTRIVLKKVLVGLPLSGGLLAIFSTNWGLTGVAIAMVISYFSTALLLNIIFDRSFYVIQLRALGLNHD